MASTTLAVNDKVLSGVHMTTHDLTLLSMPNPDALMVCPGALGFSPCRDPTDPQAPLPGEGK